MSVVRFRPRPPDPDASATHQGAGALLQSDFDFYKNRSEAHLQLFLSWSGDQSKEVALILRDWLPSVIQAIGDPWVSDADIDKGERWFESITESLSKAEGVGVFCITAENLSSPWMSFEAGALAVNDRGRVATFLFGVSAGDLKPPLSLFQATVASDKEDVLKLVRMVNKRVAVPLKDERLNRAFETAWPMLEQALSQVKPVKASPKKVNTEQLQLELLESILNTVRRIEKDSRRPPDTGRFTFFADSALPKGPGLLGDWEPSDPNKLTAYANLLRNSEIGQKPAKALSVGEIAALLAALETDKLARTAGGAHETPATRTKRGPGRK